MFFKKFRALKSYDAQKHLEELRKENAIVFKKAKPCIHNWKLVDKVLKPYFFGMCYQLNCSECGEGKLLTAEAYEEFIIDFPQIAKDCRITGHDYKPTGEEVKYFGESQQYNCCHKCGKTIIG